MASRLPRVCVLSQFQGLFRQVQKALPLSEVVDVKYPEKESEAWQAEERQKVLDAEVLLADPDIIGKHSLLYLPHLKWMQSTFDGIDPLFKSLDKTKPYPTYRLTRFGAHLGAHMAEYVIAMIISRERRFPDMSKDQENKEWRQRDYGEYRLLSKLTLGIIGIGEIGRDVARAAKSFGMCVWGLGSQEGSPRVPCNHVDEYRGPSGMAELLAESDYVVSVVPSTPQTAGMLSGNVLAPCRNKKSLFISIGRGDVINEESIIKALSEGWIRGAVLDVFEKEPLPTTSALWEHPAVTISPHTSGFSKAEEVHDVFVENYQLYVDGKPLKHEVNWQSGY